MLSLHFDWFWLCMSHNNAISICKWAAIVQYGFYLDIKNEFQMLVQWRLLVHFFSRITEKHAKVVLNVDDICCLYLRDLESQEFCAHKIYELLWCITTRFWCKNLMVWNLRDSLHGWQYIFMIYFDTPQTRFWCKSHQCIVYMDGQDRMFIWGTKCSRMKPRFSMYIFLFVTNRL